MAKILLVEDDKSLREIYGVRLMAEGYEIVSAGDGEEALAMAIKERPDLIVSDVMMPKISGFDMLDILRSTTETKDVKVIMMTALSSDDQRARGESLGADRYLVKSQVGIEDVVRTVHDVLGDSIAAPAPAAPTFAPGGVPVGPAPAPESAPAPSTVFDAAPTAAPIPEPVAAPAPLQAEAPQPAPAQPEQPAAFAMPTPTPAPTPAPEPMPAFDPNFAQQPTPTPAASTAPAFEPPFAQPAPFQAEAPQPTPASFQPAPAPTAPVASEPAQAPATTPASAPVPPNPTLSELPADPVQLPQPTAPFSYPAPASLGERIIEPLTNPAVTQPTDISAQMEQALNGQAAQPQPQPQDQPPLPPSA